MKSSTPGDGRRLISDDLERVFYNYTLASLRNRNSLNTTVWPLRLSRRMRLSMWWRSLRYDIGHRIVGYECEDG